MATGITGISYDTNLALIRSIVNTHPLDKINDVQSYQEYPILGMFNSNNRAKIKGGDKIIDRINLKPDQPADFVLPDEEVSYSADDRVVTVEQDWSRTHKSWVISDYEMNVNRGDDGWAEKLFDFADVRRLEAVKGHHRTFEDGFWGAKTDSSDTRRPDGVPWHIRKAAIAATGEGFNGITGRYSSSGTSTSWLGIDRNDSANALSRNYTEVYTDYSDFRDMGTRFQRTLQNLTFTAPGLAKGMVRPYSTDFQAYTPQEVILALTQAARAGGDAFGFEVDGGGTLSYCRVPLNRAIPTETDTTDPIYIINWARWSLFKRDGWFMHEMNPMRDPQRPTVILNNIFCEWNMRCDNPRVGGAVLHKVTST